MAKTRETILVTGGAGFIGSHLIKKLLDKDYKVICVDDFNDYYPPIWKHQNISEFQENPDFTLYSTDIRLGEELRPIFVQHKIDRIVHLAARAGVRPSILRPMLYETVNVKGTLNLLEYARRFQLSQFIFASSSSVYGNQKDTPFSEKDPVNTPISPYAATKKAGEMFCYTYAHLYSIPTTCLRFFTVYGPKGRPDMAPYKFTRAIMKEETVHQYGNGKTMRDYTYIDDIVDGIVKALKTPFDFEIINLGNHKPVTLKEFISTLESVSGKTAKIKILDSQPGDVDITYADIKKAKRLLGWEPKTPLEKGLKKFVDWYQEHRL